VRFLGKAITYTRASDRRWKTNTKLHLNDFRLDITSLDEGLPYFWQMMLTYLFTF